ncbi:MAG: hypothetical protein WDA18_09330 [Candidatus Ratteibacteria bacterium]|jgi:hypothetical protein
MNYKTNFKTIKKVYQIAKRVGLEGLFSGESTFDFQKLADQLFEHEVVNEFCRTVTGLDDDFEESYSLLELERVILGFFDAIKESLKGSEIVKRISLTAAKA